MLIEAKGLKIGEDLGIKNFHETIEIYEDKTFHSPG